MSIHQTIKQAQQIVKQLSTQSETDTKLLQQLTQKLDTIAQYVTTIDNDIDKPEMKSGCYIFSDEKGFFCPNCYDHAGQKVATKRLNSKLRVCPNCRSSIQ